MTRTASSARSVARSGLSKTASKLRFRRRLQRPQHWKSSRSSNALLAEATLHVGASQAAFLRAERVGKDELFPSYDPFHVRVFPIASVQAGYRYELPRRGPVALGVGASGAIALLPEFLDNEYGRRPLSYWLFASARLR